MYTKPMYTRSVLIIIATIAISFTASAQNKWYRPLFEKNDWIVYGSQILSGAATGVREEVLYHPAPLFEMYPHLNRQWWDIRVSYRNKYNESPTLVAFSDANHFFKAAALVTNCVSVGFTFGEYNRYAKKDLWKVIVKKIVFSYIANKIGFAATYNLLYKNQMQL
jgi:hypothetical protein